MEPDEDDAAPDSADQAAPKASRRSVSMWWRRLKSADKAGWIVAAVTVAGLVLALRPAAPPVVSATIVQRPAPATSATAGADECPLFPQMDDKSGTTDVAVYERIPGGCWGQVYGYAAAGQEIEYLIYYLNGSDAAQNQVVVRANLPPGFSYVNDSTRLTSTLFVGFRDTPNAITTDGIMIGSYEARSVAYATFRVVIPSQDEMPCGQTTYTLVGIAHPISDPEYHNTATLETFKDCPESR